MKGYSCLLGLLFFILMRSSFAQELSTVSYGLRSPFQTNTIYDLYFSSDSLLYAATSKGLWVHNGIDFKEITKVDGSSIEGSSIKETAKEKLFMLDFNRQLYTVKQDSLRKVVPPKTVGQEIISTHLGSNHIYYLERTKVHVYDLEGKHLRTLDHADKWLDKVVSTDGYMGTTITDNTGKKIVYTSRLKDGILTLYDDLWDFNLDRSFGHKRLIRSENGSTIVSSDGSLQLDITSFSKKISPRFIRKIKGKIMVGCMEGLFIPVHKELLLEGKDVTDIVEDSEGNIWIATLNNGLHKVTSLNNRFYPIANEESAVHLIFKKENQLLYADVGSNVYHLEGGKFRRIYESPFRFYPKNLYYDQMNHTYVYSGSFLQLFDDSLTPTFYHKSYGELVKDREGHIIRKHRFDARILYAQLNDYLHDSLSVVSNIHPDTLFVNRYYKLLSYKDKVFDIDFVKWFKNEETYKWRDKLIYFANDTLYFDDLISFKTIHKNKVSGQFQKLTVIDDIVYLITAAEIIQYSLNGERLNTIQRLRGLQQKLNFISADHDYLAVTTSAAVYLFKSQTLEHLYTLNRQNGMYSVDFNKAWIFDGYLYANGSEGLTEIKLDHHSFNRGSPKVQLKQLKVNGYEIEGNDFSYQQNNLRLAFEARSYTVRGQLFWRLNGRDWRAEEGEPIIVLDDLKHGAYKVEAYWENEIGGKSPVFNYSFVIHKPFWLTWWFFVSLATLLFGITLFIYRRRMRQVQQRNNLENGLIASQVTALKSQMNPHFIFNALNSIQSLIIYKKNDEAFNYVDKFSVLLRQILKYSDKDFIPLYQEIEMLKNYLAMEKMRFDGNLSIEMEEYEDKDVSIPSMIIQPFVENAIKHGLLHKKSGEKTIKISFQLHNNETIICEIEDNGIGRAASQALQKENRRHGESFSTGATQKRLELLQKLHFTSLGVQYVDLTDENGAPQGTRVKITIPIE